jgi:hypothetical protein
VDEEGPCLVKRPPLSTHCTPFCLLTNSLKNLYAITETVGGYDEMVDKCCYDFRILRWLMLWRIDPLLGKDLETNKKTAVALQRRGKHASTTIELLLETMFSTRSVQRVIRKTIGATQSIERR